MIVINLTVSIIAFINVLKTINKTGIVRINLKKRQKIIIIFPHIITLLGKQTPS